MPKGSLKDKLEGNEIDLSLSNLEVVPVKELAAIPRGTHLDLSCNLLVSLPDNFATLTHLVKIDLSKNQLTELPRDFGKLESLQHLDLLDNRLTMLPESFAQLRKLKWLDLKDNPLEPGLKKNAGDCLDEKQCRACAERILLYMKEYSSGKERQRQKKLKQQRDKEAKQKAIEEEEARKKKELKKAEKDRRKREAEAKRSLEKKEESGSDEEIGDGDDVKVDKRETRKDKTGRGFCSCFVMVTSILVLAVALVAGLVFHCGSNSRDRYCRDYFNPVQKQFLRTQQKTQKRAGEFVDAAVTWSLDTFDKASYLASDWLDSGKEVAHSLYVSAVELMDGGKGATGGDGDASPKSGKT